VQGEIEKAMEHVLRQKITAYGAGRTDAGVHALGQVISFTADTKLEIARMAPALNSQLPTDIRIRRADEADGGFHARFSALARRYVYVALNRSEPTALLRRYVWHIVQPLDVDAMQRGAATLVGVHDFAAWANGTSEVTSTERELYECRLRRKGAFVLLIVEGSGFLRGMVRNIMGTLAEVGLGRRSPNEMTRITESRNRANAGRTAPACGLCLVRVRY